VWASLAGDFLSVMASSVSSERAFSSAGITISKRRNSLNAVTVEALQFLKCMYRRELNFREFLSSACAEGVQEEPEKDDIGEVVPDHDSPNTFDLDFDSDSDSDA
jgi:hypothetical protein